MTLLSSLTNRIFAASALLVVITTGAAMYFVQRAVSERAESDLTRGLDEAASLVDTISRTQFTDFLVKAELIADLPVLRGAVSTEDAPTIQPIAVEYQRTLGADVFVLVARDGHLLAQAGRAYLTQPAVDQVLAACRGRADRTAFWPIAGGLLHVASIPLEAAGATLLVGSRLDREAADGIKAITQTEIAFIQATAVIAATVDLRSTADAQPVAGQPGVVFIPIGGEDYIGRLQPLGPADGPDVPAALVLRSRSELTRFLRQLRWQLVAAGAATVLVATLVGYVVARTVTRPLRALTGTMQAMAATGDLGRAMPALGRWDDEDVRVVASTFSQLTSALDRFQREASVRERLSSLGRLSAVIAHEIRNPLMIIKSSVRALRRHPSQDVASAATSIDEEVGRVNRVVTGVLDFARPLTFTLAAADLADICRTAAHATMASGEDVPVVVVAEPSSTAIVTDVERLRLVLINLLTNAQQAVRSVPLERRSTSPIALHVTRLPNGRWCVRIRDEGPGIAPDDLARVFDPFFTTRNTGSGLGLAISRNIIEGLGGVIRVESPPGSGATIVIELPGPSEPSERRV